jgi:hypothetical protein
MRSGNEDLKRASPKQQDWVEVKKNRAKKGSKPEVYGVSTRYIPNTNAVSAKGIAIPPPKQGMPDHPFHPSGGSQLPCPHGHGSCRVGCLERRGELFSLAHLPWQQCPGCGTARTRPARLVCPPPPPSLSWYNSLVDSGGAKLAWLQR